MGLTPWLVLKGFVVESRTAAIRELLSAHCQENRLQVKHSTSDGREKFTLWQQRWHRMQAQRKKRA